MCFGGKVHDMINVRKFIRSRMGFALISNMLILLVSLCFFRPFWEESDDIGMALLAEGAYGGGEPHLLYAGIAYGKILCLLQGLFPAVRWHAIVMLLAWFVISAAFVYVLCEDRRGKILSAIFLLGSFYEISVSIQFSKVATVIGLCSFLILFECSTPRLPIKVRRVLTVIATAGVAFSLILRLESFLLAAMIGGCYGICRLIYEMKTEGGKGKIASYLKVFLPAFALAGMLFLADLYAYSSGGWKDYKDYYNSVTGMVDYHNNALLYDLHGDELKDLKVSENDALLYITYGSLEHEITTNELMDRISRLDPKGISYINADLIKAWIANLYDEILVPNSVVTALLLLTGLVFVFLKGTGRRYITSVILIQAAVGLAVLFYYQYSSRYCHRVVYALLLAQLVLVTYILHGLEGYDFSRPVLTCVFLMLALPLARMRLGNEFAYREYERTAFGYDEFISYMEDRKDTLFVSDVFTMIDYGKYDVFRPGRPGQFDNFLQTDSVFIANSPVNKAIADRYGYGDPFEALCSGSENVLLADGISPEVELTFLKEHGDRGYRLEEKDKAGGISLYAVR